MPASRRGRSAESSSRAISSAAASCSLNLPARSKPSKVMSVAYHEDPVIPYNALEEGFVDSQAPAELDGRIEAGVDFAPQFVARALQARDQLGEAGLADHHEVEVDARALVAPGDPAIDEREVDALGEGLERLAQHAGDSRGLAQDPPQLLVDGTVGVGLEMDLVADGLAQQDARLGELGQLAPERARRLAREAAQFAHV